MPARLPPAPASNLVSCQHMPAPYAVGRPESQFSSKLTHTSPGSCGNGKIGPATCNGVEGLDVGLKRYFALWVLGSFATAHCFAYLAACSSVKNCGV